MYYERYGGSGTLEMASSGVIGNTKTFILGTYHGLEKKHLQVYLDEFSYRFNRRNFSGQIFNRLLNACMKTSTTYEELVCPVST
jgi:hypothetical protein